MVELLMPVKNDGIRTERGQRFSAWLKSVAVNPLTGEVLNPTEIARMVGVQVSIARVWLNDCYDETEERIKLPGEANIDRIAAKFNADPNAGREAAGRPLKTAPIPDDAPNIEYFVTRTGVEAWIKTPHGTRMDRSPQHRALIELALEGIAKVEDST